MRAVLFIPAVVLAALASGCSSAPTGPSQPDQPSIRLIVAPSSARISGGSQLRLLATVNDAEGERVLSEGVSWLSLNSDVAAVDGGGLVLGVEAGQTKIVAHWGDARATALITVVTTRSGCAELALGGSALLGGNKTACQ